MQAAMDQATLTKDMIFEKVIRGQHLTAEEKEFVLNGYKVVAHVAEHADVCIVTNGTAPSSASD